MSAWPPPRPGRCAAVVTQVLPDIDDFERTDLLAQICRAASPRCCCSPRSAERCSASALPAKLREQPAPGCVFLAVALTAWELVTAKFHDPAPAVLRLPAGVAGGVHRRLRAAGGQRLAQRPAAGRGLRHRRDRRLHLRRGSRLVAGSRLLGASGAAADRPAAGDGLAADGVLRLSVQPQRQHVPRSPWPPASR